jgi:hypothetical protein
MVSFKSDVIPSVFQASCAVTSSCHGQMNNVMAMNLYLGPTSMDVPHPTTADINTAWNAIVNVSALENTSMKLVAPGSTATSFLWQKVQPDPNADSATKMGCAATLATNPPISCVDCTMSQPCGTFMPYLGTGQLTSDQLCTLESWITQGAMNN